MRHGCDAVRAGRAGVLALLLAAAVEPLAAQGIGFTPVAVAEVSGDEASLFLLGVSAAPRRPGVVPVANVQVYRVEFPLGPAGAAEIWAFSPSVGLRRARAGGFLEARIGYVLHDNEADVPFFEGGEDGVTTALQAEHWGNGAWAFSGIASYNWGASFLWSRARALVAVLRAADGRVRVGGEVVWQGELEEERVGEGYRAIQLGPVVQWAGSRGLIMGLGGGWKNDNLADDTSWYARVEVVFAR